MIIEEMIKGLVVQSPAIAILLYMTHRLYTDWQAERASRDAMAERYVIALEKISYRLDEIEDNQENPP